MSQNLQVNLGGLIDVLSNHLYSSPAVYLRESLQNAVDAVHARDTIGRHDGPLPPIRFEPITPNQGPPTLVVDDAGIGLTSGDIEQFLMRCLVLNRFPWIHRSLRRHRHRVRWSEFRLAGSFVTRRCPVGASL